MKLSKAIEKAMQIFEKRNLGDIRLVSIWEVSGFGDNVDHATIHIEYAKNGKYVKSDEHPFLVSVDEEEEGKITCETI
jgi:hypothetical protein